MKTVILLKNRSIPHDSYDTIFREHGYSVEFVPLLKSTQINQQVIQSFLTSQDYIENYRAMIVTSQHSVETLDSVLEQLKKEKSPYLGHILNKPVYTVGPATSNALNRIGFTDIRGGNDAGNGSILADILIGDDLFKGTDSKKVLFVMGKKHKHIIPDKLRDAKFQLKELISYETEPLDDILKRFTTSISNADKTQSKWIAFFSPQGTEEILKFLKTQLNNQPVNTATIGPTTRKFLEKKGLKIDATAVKPNADELFKSIDN